MSVLVGLSVSLTSSCAWPPEAKLLPAEENKFQLAGASPTGSRFIFIVRHRVVGDYCVGHETQLRTMIAEALGTKGACLNGFATGAASYSPPDCRVAVQCK